MDVGFDCASSSEIRHVLSLGVRPERIIFASPCKDYDQIQYARVCGVRKTVFDSESELLKLSRCHPEAELYLRIWADDPQCRVRLGQKLGAPVEYGRYLLQRAEALKVNVVGLCFHVGSSASDPSTYARAIAHARAIYDAATQRGFCIHSIDVGGGFTSTNLTEVSHALRYAMEQHFGSILPTIRWMAEPGRLFVQDAFTLACRVSGMRQVRPDQPVDVYINDSIYKNFLNALAEPPIPEPLLLTGRPNVDDYLYEAVADRIPQQLLHTVWGQTCCGLDRIRTDCQFSCPVQVDDWILFPNMGGEL